MICSQFGRLPIIYRINASCLNQNIIMLHEPRAIYFEAMTKLNLNYCYHKDQSNYWKIELDQAKLREDFIRKFDAVEKLAVNNSLQLAYKIILNSFSHYVLNKESRWYLRDIEEEFLTKRLEIDQKTYRIIEKMGIMLATDNDGMWCLLPETFPGKFTIHLSDGNELSFSFLSLLLNFQTNTDLKVGNRFNNYFEVDDGFRAVILPWFDHNRAENNIAIAFTKAGNLEENKIFDLVKFNEKNLMKFFEMSILPQFLKGNSLKECYQHVNKLSMNFLKMLELKGEALSEKEIIKYFTECRVKGDSTISSSPAIIVVERMSEFLGREILNESRVTCHFLITSEPKKVPARYRAIPTEIFSADENVKKIFLRKWLGDPNMESFNIRNILDWDYYNDKLQSLIKKLVTHPSNYQVKAKDNNKENESRYTNPRKRLKNYPESSIKRMRFFHKT
jgi:DNA polymerase epsilon subunit 1